MDDNFFGFPLVFGSLFVNDSDAGDYFLSLPEETQQALMNEEIHSAKDLHDCVERLKLKE